MREAGVGPNIRVSPCHLLIFLGPCRFFLVFQVDWFHRMNIYSVCTDAEYSIRILDRRCLIQCVLCHILRTANVHADAHSEDVH